MSEPNQPQTLEQAFPILARIESVPLAECKAAYDRYDESSPGDQIVGFTLEARQAKSTRDYLQFLWPGNFLKYSEIHRNDFALATEYIIRTRI